MSSETLLLDKTEERTPSPSLRKSFEIHQEKAIKLREDTTLPGRGRTLWQEVRWKDASVEKEEGQEQAGSIEILFEALPYAGRGHSPLRSSLRALGELRSSASIDWVEAAVVLKRDVARLSGSNYSRHAAVLLALADGFTFTEPNEVADGVGPLVNHALGLLSEPYIAEVDEEEFLGELVMAGWNLAPSEEQAAELVG